MSLSAPMVFLPTEQGNLKYRCGMCNPGLRLLHIQKCKVPTVPTRLLRYLLYFLELVLDFHLRRLFGKPVTASFTLPPSNNNIARFFKSRYVKYSKDRNLSSTFSILPAGATAARPETASAFPVRSSMNTRFCGY